MRTRKPLLFLLSALFLSTPLSAQVYDVYVIPAVANAQGGFGTRWASEIHVFNPQPHHLNIEFIFVPSGGGTARSEVFRAESNQTLFAENILRDVFVLEGTGSLTISVPLADNPHADSVVERAFVAGSRVYNTTSNGTYGQRINGEFDPLMDDGLTAIADGITHGAGTQFRTNVGAVNLGRYNVQMRVQAFDADGNAVGGAMPFELPPMGHMQDILPVQLEHGTLEFSMIDRDPAGESTVFPYASVVDNRTGDAVYISPRLLALPTGLYCPNDSVTGTSIERRLAASASTAVSTTRGLTSADLDALRATAIRTGLVRVENGRMLSRDR